MTLADTPTLLNALHFSQDPANPSRYTKQYPAFPYAITVDIDGNTIDYGTKIYRGDTTTSNLNQSENLVVLECVDRLLTKGYFPEDITLEKRYKVGHGTSGGKSDVVVKNRVGKGTLLIIECKTAGAEFEGELARTEKVDGEGGQLFSYYQQDKSAKFLCLYASRLTDEGAVHYDSALLSTEDSEEDRAAQDADPSGLHTFAKATTVADLVKVWNNKSQRLNGSAPQLARQGIFEEDRPAYQPGYRPLRIGELREFSIDDKSRVFNEFEEILRHNNISDRSNAFNRIVSLILAKIVDEGKGSHEEADFQIIEGRDSAERLHERLQTLYTKAMREYLGETVVNYTEAELEYEIKDFPRQAALNNIRRMLRELKYYSNNEFAFKEVYNETLFRANSRALEEVVRLFQPYRFKHNRKAQVLGELFELLLESGYKQSEGQFFTPTPIARFLVSSLPLAKMTKDKLARRERRFLPYIIDYACGSGHFLTESLDAVQDVLGTLNPEDYDPATSAEIRNWQGSMAWAGTYLFGIEKDYRLARTSQVACFMHGDGDATIKYGDGLETHPDSQLGPEKNGTFDVVVANPPYSVADFKQHLRVPSTAYKLLEGISETSSSIEILFIERTAQLLRTGGVAAIILPSGIVGNRDYVKARAFLLENFTVVGMVKFGNVTFGATGTVTVAFFLVRRHPDETANAAILAEDLITLGTPRPPEHDALNGEAKLSDYQQYIGLTAEQYKGLLIADTSVPGLVESEAWDAYVRWLSKHPEWKGLMKKPLYTKLKTQAEKDTMRTDLWAGLIRTQEAERFRFFLLAQRQNTLLIRGGESTREQQTFLGYKFSDRRGYKGLTPKRPDASGNPTTPLYDGQNLDNPAKINTHLRAALAGESALPIPSELTAYMTTVPLIDCLDLERVDYELTLSLTPKVDSLELIASLGGEIVRLRTVATPKRDQQAGDEDKLVDFFGLEHIEKHTGQLMPGWEKSAVASTSLLFQRGNILYGKLRPNLNKVWLADREGVCSTEFVVLETAHPYLLSTVLKFPEIVAQAASKVTNSYPRIKPEQVGELLLPYPELEQRDDVEAALIALEKDTNLIYQEEIDLLADYAATIARLYVKGIKQERLEKYFEFNSSSADPKAVYGENEFTYVDIESVSKGSGEVDFTQRVRGVDAASRAQRIAKPKTVLLSTVRPNLKGFAYIEQAPEDTIFSTGFALLTSKDETKYRAKLLYALFQYSSDIMQQLKRAMPKGQYPSVNRDDLERITLPVPTAATEAIFTEVEQRLNELDAKQLEIREKRASIPEQQRLTVLNFLKNPEAVVPDTEDENPD